MAKFASPIKQAASVMKQLQQNDIKSVGTVRNYESALTRVAEYLAASKQGSLRSLSASGANTYLEYRSEQVGQSQLNMERQAMQKMMLNVTNKLNKNEKLTVMKSLKLELVVGRSYSTLQVEMISNAQQAKNALSTQIALQTGIRAHELYTLLPVKERAADIRPALISKFAGRAGVKYTVIGKGGLVREIMLPKRLSEQLERQRLPNGIIKQDRGVNYKQHYNINAGARWSNSFSRASKRTLGYSNGGHGLRHTYAQKRMKELLKLGYSRQQALETVSQELGHFRADITKVYLR